MFFVKCHFSMFSMKKNIMLTYTTCWKIHDMYCTYGMRIYLHVCVYVCACACMFPHIRAMPSIPAKSSPRAAGRASSLSLRGSPISEEYLHHRTWSLLGLVGEGLQEEGAISSLVTEERAAGTQQNNPGGGRQLSKICPRNNCT
jgi:hypothetical protein